MQGWPDKCAIGAGPGYGHNAVFSIFEFTGSCSSSSKALGLCTKNPSDPTKDLAEADYFDLSNVEGSTVPMRLEVVGDASTHRCSYAAMDSITDLASCPRESSATIAHAQYRNPQLDGDGISLLWSFAKGNAACMSPKHWLLPPGGAGSREYKDCRAFTGSLGESAQYLRLVRLQCRAVCGGGR